MFSKENESIQCIEIIFQGDLLFGLMMSEVGGSTNGLTGGTIHSGHLWNQRQKNQQELTSCPELKAPGGAQHEKMEAPEQGRSRV